MLLLFGTLLFGQWFSHAAGTRGANRLFWAALGVEVWLVTTIAVTVAADAFLWPLFDYDTTPFYFNHRTVLHNLALGTILAIVPGAWISERWLVNADTLPPQESDLIVKVPDAVRRRFNAGFIAACLVCVATLVQGVHLMLQNSQWLNQPLLFSEFCLALALTLGASKKSRVAFALLVLLYAGAIGLRYSESRQLWLLAPGALILFWLAQGLWATVQYARARDA